MSEENKQIPEEIKTAVYEALGAASMCWNPKPHTQVFDSESALKIGDELLEKISLISQEKEREHIIHVDRETDKLMDELDEKDKRIKELEREPLDRLAERSLEMARELIEKDKRIKELEEVAFRRIKELHSQDALIDKYKQEISSLKAKLSEKEGKLPSCEKCGYYLHPEYKSCLRVCCENY